MKIILELNETQYGNLLAFLERVTMNGNEAIPYVELLSIINNARKPVATTGGFSRKGDETE